MRVHAVLPARSASPWARSRASPVEKTAAVSEATQGAARRGGENHWLRREFSHIHSKFAIASGDLVKSGIYCLRRVLTRARRYLASRR